MLLCVIKTDNIVKVHVTLFIFIEHAKHIADKAFSKGIYWTPHALNKLFVAYLIISFGVEHVKEKRNILFF